MPSQPVAPSAALIVLPLGFALFLLRIVGVAFEIYAEVRLGLLPGDTDRHQTS